MKHRRLSQLALSATTAILYGGCVTDGLVSDPIEVPSRWSTPALAYAGPVSADGWLQDISSKELPPLVREAQEHNFDLKAAAARMRAARARQVIEGADRFPQVRGVQDSSRSLRVDQDDLRQRANDFDLALNLSWEIDLWGRLRDVSDAAAQDADATEADFLAARLSLAGNTAKAWFNAIETELQVELAKETLVSFQSNLDIIQRAFNAGVDEPGGDNALDLRLARANVAGAENQVALSGRNRDASARALETLLGRYPSNELQVANELPPISRRVPAGLPSELLLRRPDLIAAELRLRGEGFRVRAAKKAFLPAFTLTARGGTNSSEFSELLDPDRLVANLAGGIVQPITEGGRLRGAVALSQADRDELLQRYAQAALDAFREVETTLAAEHYLASQETALVTAASESDAAERLAVVQYGRGIVDIITVLDSQRRAFNSKSALIAIRNERLQNRIDLYLALGGDFESAPR
ncbi:MAG: efflux transporter outer membrane subunit [Verrucomicrobiales bacterium]